MDKQRKLFDSSNKDNLNPADKEEYLKSIQNYKNR